MIPVMVVLAAQWPHSMDPSEPAFWFRMSVASIAGGVLAFPINRWLVENHLKHGCMTLPGADGPAPALGHRSPEAQAAGGEHGMAMGHENAGGQAGHHEGHQTPGDRHEMAEMMSHFPDEGHGGVHEHHGMAMRELSLGASLLWILGTYAVLLGAVWLTAQWVPIRFHAM